MFRFVFGENKISGASGIEWMQCVITGTKPNKSLVIHPQFQRHIQL
jgi:hypothetical protein